MPRVRGRKGGTGRPRSIATLHVVRPMKLGVVIPGASDPAALSATLSSLEPLASAFDVTAYPVVASATHWPATEAVMLAPVVVARSGTVYGDELNRHRQVGLDAALADAVDAVLLLEPGVQLTLAGRVRVTAWIMSPDRDERLVALVGKADVAASQDSLTNRRSQIANGITALSQWEPDAASADLVNLVLPRAACLALQDVGGFPGARITLAERLDRAGIECAPGAEFSVIRGADTV